jgi:hypothetical protein
LRDAKRNRRVLRSNCRAGTIDHRSQLRDHHVEDLVNVEPGADGLMAITAERAKPIGS